MEAHFQQAGFLADEMQEWAAAHSPRAARHMRLANDISVFVQSRIYYVHIRRKDCHQRREYRQPIVALLFMRGMSAFQAGILLAQRGMPAEAGTACRSLLDLVFKCYAIERDPSALPIFMAEDEHYRLRLCRNLLKHPELYQGAVTEAELRERIATIKKTIEEMEHHKELPMAEWARMAGMESSYRTVYAYFSSYVHTGVRTLENMTVIEDDVLEELKFEPVVSESIFSCANEYVLFLCQAMAREFGLDWDEQLTRFRATLEELEEDRKRDSTEGIGPRP